MSGQKSLDSLSSSLPSSDRFLLADIVGRLVHLEDTLTTFLQDIPLRYPDLLQCLLTTSSRDPSEVLLPCLRLFESSVSEYCFLRSTLAFLNLFSTSTSSGQSSQPLRRRMYRIENLLISLGVVFRTLWVVVIQFVVTERIGCGNGIGIGIVGDIVFVREHFNSVVGQFFSVGGHRNRTSNFDRFSALRISVEEIALRVIDARLWLRCVNGDIPSCQDTEKLFFLNENETSRLLVGLISENDVMDRLWKIECVGLGLGLGLRVGRKEEEEEEGEVSQRLDFESCVDEDDDSFLIDAFLGGGIEVLGIGGGGGGSTSMSMSTSTSGSLSEMKMRRKRRREKDVENEIDPLCFQLGQDCFRRVSSRRHPRETEFFLTVSDVREHLARILAEEAHFVLEFLRIHFKLISSTCGFCPISNSGLDPPEEASANSGVEDSHSSPHAPSFDPVPFVDDWMEIQDTVQEATRVAGVELLPPRKKVITNQTGRRKRKRKEFVDLSSAPLSLRGPYYIHECTRYASVFECPPYAPAVGTDGGVRSVHCDLRLKFPIGRRSKRVRFERPRLDNTSPKLHLFEPLFCHHQRRKSKGVEFSSKTFQDPTERKWAELVVVGLVKKVTMLADPCCCGGDGSGLPVRNCRRSELSLFALRDWAGHLRRFGSKSHREYLPTEENMLDEEREQEEDDLRSEIQPRLVVESFRTPVFRSLVDILKKANPIEGLNGIWRLPMSVELAVAYIMNCHATLARIVSISPQLQLLCEIHNDGLILNYLLSVLRGKIASRIGESAPTEFLRSVDTRRTAVGMSIAGTKQILCRYVRSNLERYWAAHRSACRRFFGLFRVDFPVNIMEIVTREFLIPELRVVCSLGSASRCELLQLFVDTFFKFYARVVLLDGPGDRRRPQRGGGRLPKRKVPRLVSDIVWIRQWFRETSLLNVDEKREVVWTSERYLGVGRRIRVLQLRQNGRSRRLFGRRRRKNRVFPSPDGRDIV